MEEALTAVREAAAPRMAAWMRVAHVLGIIVFLGGSLACARLLGLLGKADDATRVAAAALGRRVYLTLTFPAVLLFLVSGLHLAFSDPWKRDYFRQDWFLVKLILVAVVLMVDHLLVIRPLKGLAKGTGEASGHLALARPGFWLLGLLSVALLAVLFVFRP